MGADCPPEPRKLKTSRAVVVQRCLIRRLSVTALLPSVLHSGCSLCCFLGRRVHARTLNPCYLTVDAFLNILHAILRRGRRIFFEGARATRHSGSRVGAVRTGRKMKVRHVFLHLREHGRSLIVLQVHSFDFFRYGLTEVYSTAPSSRSSRAASTRAWGRRRKKFTSTSMAKTEGTSTIRWSTRHTA